MRFNPKARLDRSQVQVRRGGGRGSRRVGGSGMSLPIPTGGKGGAGMVVVVVIVLVVLGLTGGLGGLLGGDSGGGAVTPRSDEEPVSTSELTECETGEDANENPDCARLAVVNSIQSFWREALPEQAGRAVRRRRHRDLHRHRRHRLRGRRLRRSGPSTARPATT